MGWLIALEQVAGAAEDPLAQPEWIQHTLSNLVKTAEDQQRTSEIVNRWINKRTR